jgi:hypothetical protein
MNSSSLTSLFFHVIRILEEDGMKIRRLFLPACFLLLILFFTACGSETTNTQTETAREITVTLRNKDTKAVHMLFEGYKVGSENIVNPNSSIQATVTAQRIGHKFSFYVYDAADPDGVPLWTTTSIEVMDASWNSRTAELHWEGDDLLFVGW